MSSVMSREVSNTNGNKVVLAARAGDLATVNNLLEIGTDVNSRCPPPLGKFNNGTAEMVGSNEVFWGNITHSAPRESFKQTALQAAAEGGHQELLVILIQAGANINGLPADICGRTALQAAAEGGHEAVVKFLMDSRADVNSPPAKYSGRTALQAAAEGGHEVVVKFLMNSGADVNSRPAKYSRRTALQAAAKGGHEAVVKLLVDAGADVNSPPVNYRRTALQAAVEGGHEALVKFLVDAKADVNALSAKNGGITPLQGVLQSRNLEILGMLISNHISIYEKNNLGRTFLHHACESWDSYKLSLVLKLDAFDINAKDYFGSTPLHIAVYEKNEVHVEALIQKNASMDINDDSGKTPLQLALEKGLKKHTASFT